MRELLTTHQSLSPEVIDRLESLGYTPSTLLHDIYLHNGYWNHDLHPCVGLTSVAKYDDDNFVEMWLDLATFTSYDEYQRFVKAVNADEPDPQLLFSKSEYFPKRWFDKNGLTRETFDRLQELIRLSRVHPVEALIAYLKWNPTDDDLVYFEDCYCGHYDSQYDFAKKLAYENIDIDRVLGDLAPFFDFNAYADHLFAKDYYEEDGDVFRQL